MCTRGDWNAITRMVAAYHPLPKNPWPAVDRCASRVPRACLAGPLEGLGRLQFVPGGLEGENRILEAATGSPSAVSDRRWAHAGLGPTAI